MSKIVVIGIDGMDYELVRMWKSELPVFSNSMQEGKFFPLQSVFPPDSVPGWTTIYTGLNPVEHGVLQHINYLSKGTVKISIDNFKGRTFWDIAGKRGKKVCVINPFMAYPVWTVNGVMVNGSYFINGPVQSFPESVVGNNGKLPKLGGYSDFPRKDNVKEFIHNNRNDVMSLKDYAIKLFQADNYDLCFVTFLNLDRVQHFLWRYYDEEDPTYPGKNQFSNVIKDFYKLFDDTVDSFQKAFPDSVIMVISDHGHGRRCENVVNINEFLRQRGYLFSKGDSAKFLNYKFIIEKAKNYALNLFYKYDMEDLLYRVSPYIPYKKSLKDSSFLMTPSENLAEVDTHFGGVNPFGGIRINKTRIKSINGEYEKFRRNLMDELLELNNGIQKKDLFKRICTREDMYTGDHIELYPDILFELNPEYGVSPSLYTKIFSKSTTHKKISGGHREYGILGLSNLSCSIKNDVPSLMQISPTILDIMNCCQESEFIYKSILEKKRS